MRRVGVAAAALLLGIFIGCSSSDDDSPGLDLPDDDAEGQYKGPAKGDTLPASEGGASFVPSLGLDSGIVPGDADPPCCETTFGLEDATNDETTAVLRGSFGPLVGDGVPLTYANGRWSAKACVPIGAYIEYWFHFGQVHENQDEGSGPLVDDDRHDPQLPKASDGKGGFVNTVQLASCVAPPDGGPADAGPTSSDGIRNGTESDVDCGGGAPTNAERCAVGMKCSVIGDCASGVCTAQGFCSHAGRLYATMHGANAFRGFASASTLDGTAVSATSATVASAGGIAIDTGRDALYVASNTDDKVYVYSPASTSSGPPARAFAVPQTPWGVAVDGVGDRLFLTAFTNVIAIYDSASTLDGAGTMPSRQITATGLGTEPYGLVYDRPRDRLFVSFRGANKIAVFDAASTKNGTYAATVAREITHSTLQGPSQLAYDARRDELYVANSAGTAVTGQVTVIGSASTAAGQTAPSRTIVTTGYDTVSGIALDATRDELYITTLSHMRVPVFAAASTLNGAVATSRQVNGFSDYATGLALDLTRD
ncbi:MAG: hypothetical protein KF795_00900 [Labilithrix sp.]|nr:hypothetical protein [Labilithrix sp.]